ncbi:MAG: formamidopyrimidine-DNA glycosylase [Candidatus Parcubacteria bacterium]|nr:MAG: formamidopyrimidine-DNA glycosylase [Candidatus Parcubacteria bacterium]
MPELPEVETIKKSLARKIINKKIIKVKIFNKKSFLGNKKNIINEKIIGLERKGKILIARLANNYNLLIHLKMSGQILCFKKNNLDILNKKFIRLIFYLSSGLMIVFNDLRKFGWVKIATKNESKKILDNLGRDALLITYEELFNLCRKSKSKIKIFLMDQKKISGIGNIYACEILFLAKINPFKMVNQLTEKEIKILLRSIKTILVRAIRYNGTSMKSYIKPDNKKGDYQKHFLVYQREGEKCLRCKKKIIRVKLNNRSTFYCPYCQV